MTDGFTALAFGFCVAMAQPPGTTLEFGYISEEACVVKMDIGDTQGHTFMINDHDISVEMLDGGAEVSIDNLKFVVQQLAPA